MPNRQMKHISSEMSDENSSASSPEDIYIFQEQQRVLESVLSILEIQIGEMMTQGMKAGEIAEIRGCSSSHIYEVLKHIHQKTVILLKYRDIFLAYVKHCDVEKCLFEIMHYSDEFLVLFGKKERSFLYAKYVLGFEKDEIYQILKGTGDSFEKEISQKIIDVLNFGMDICAKISKNEESFNKYEENSLSLSLHPNLEIIKSIRHDEEGEGKIWENDSKFVKNRLTQSEKFILITRLGLNGRTPKTSIYISQNHTGREKNISAKEIFDMFVSAIEKIKRQIKNGDIEGKKRWIEKENLTLKNF